MGINERSLNRVPQSQHDGIVQLEVGSVQDMAQRLADMKNKLELVQKFFHDVMIKDVDYGIIPGTQKPSLLKPGAEKLCELYNFAIVIAEKEEEKDIHSGYYRAKLIVRLLHRGTGVLIAEGTGEANAYESKYRWRWSLERDLPRGIDRDSLVSKEFKGQYGAFMKYRLENTELFDQWNTVLKMAKKRALVDAVLSATRSSGIFSQAEDELDAWIEGEADEAGEQPQGQPRQQQPTRQNNQPKNDGNRGPATGANRGPANPNVPASEKQVKAIFGAGKGKGLSNDDIEAIVFAQTQKDVNQLTMGEASNLIGLLQNSDTNTLKAMIDYGAGTDDDAPAWFGGGQG